VRKMSVTCFVIPSTPAGAQASDNYRQAYRQGFERGIKQWAEEQLKVPGKETA